MTKYTLAVLLVLGFAVSCQAVPPIVCARDTQGRCVTPDATLTPGAVDPRVTQATIGQTICTKGYTKTVRPSRKASELLKRHVMAAYGIPWKERRFYELDHAIPIELGAAPADPRDLWPEPWDGPSGASRKDVLENTMHRLVCTGRLTLAEGQAVFRGDWRQGYQRFVGPLPAEKETP
jgi:hypothetical protein